MIFVQKPTQREGPCHADIWGKSILAEKTVGANALRWKEHAWCVHRGTGRPLWLEQGVPREDGREDQRGAEGKIA